MFRILFLFSVLLANPFAALAQPWAGFGIEANLMGGKMLKHTEKMGAALPERVTGAEVNFVHQTSGTKAWQAARKFPVVGVGLAYTDYGIDSVYGQAVSIYPNLQLRIISKPGYEWTIRGGYGFGYITKRYDRFEGDTLNKAIGSHFNNFSHFTTDFRFRASQHWDLQAGLHFFHLSNGGLRTPNLGLNVYGAHIGARYFPVTSRPDFATSDAARPPARWMLQTRVGLALTEEGPFDGPLSPTYLASLYGSRRWRGYNKVFGGVDISYHNHVEAFLKHNEILSGEEASHAYKSGAFIGNEWMLGRVGIVVQVGIYLRQAYLKLLPYYQKYGLHYYIVQREKGLLKEAFFTALLKTHNASAELAEFGLGFGF